MLIVLIWCLMWGNECRPMDTKKADKKLLIGFVTPERLELSTQ